MKRTDKNVKTIGLIVEDAFRDFSMEIIHSVAHAISGKKNLRLIVVAGKQTDISDFDERIHNYTVSYNSIYYMNGMCRFDGVIMTFPNLIGMRREIFEDIPRVFIAADVNDELLVNYDNEKGIREAIDYLVRIEGITRICMIGGRDDNADAVRRKRIFIRCLEDNGLTFTEQQYVSSNMLESTQESAALLLSRNPDVQAVFCVNDPSAVGLYDVMRDRGLTPGRDILVFGFDNAAMANDMVPRLASIGAEEITLGEKALNMLLDKLDGKEVCSQSIPTRLYGRESFEYEMHDFSAKEMLDIDTAYIDSFFDNCFYRYKNEVKNPGGIDLKRLFHEIISRMLKALRERYMSEEVSSGIGRLIDIFFENGGMRYTDANRFVKSIRRFQDNMNETGRTGAVRVEINKLFSYMKDKAIQALSYRRSIEKNASALGRDRLLDFVIYMTNYGEPGEEAIDFMVNHFDKIGLSNAALYLYENPVEYKREGKDDLPGYAMLRCVIRNKTLYVIPEERQYCPMEEIYSRSELPEEGLGYITYPLFYGNTVYGFLLCNVSRNVIEIGEFVTLQLGRTIYMNLGMKSPEP
ncbi:MAG: substrate-binding domain-containing protein [Lachnospiraceae bacterium]|nr:substrate-binding domain-containing protein [Lachnospiraceae bacterium]